jgi:hypothetical protein
MLDGQRKLPISVPCHEPGFDPDSVGYSNGQGLRCLPARPFFVKDLASCFAVLRR